MAALAIPDSGIPADGQASELDSRYIGLARHMASYSPDPSTQVGAIIVDRAGRPVSLGVNIFPEGDHAHELGLDERPHKYDANTHAERGAIYNAAREGHRLAGTTLYVTHWPCMACTTGILQSGITRVAIDEANFATGLFARSSDSAKLTLQRFEHAGVAIDVIATDDAGRTTATPARVRLAAWLADQGLDPKIDIHASEMGKAKPAASQPRISG